MTYAKNDNRRVLILFIIAAFMLVTVAHVTAYSAAFEPVFWLYPLGFLYALAVEASIVACAYFTRWQTTRLWAWVGFFLFTAASGVMNWGFIEPQTFPAGVYAVFPTGAIALLGFLYRQVDTLSGYSRKRAGSAAETDRQVSGYSRKRAGSAAEDEPELPGGLQRVPESLDDFRQMVASGEADYRKLTGDALAAVTGRHPRTGRLWLADVRNGDV